MFSFDEFSGLVSRLSVLSITFFQCGCARYQHGRLYNSAGGLESAGNGLYPIQDPLPIENPVTMLLVCSVFLFACHISVYAEFTNKQSESESGKNRLVHLEVRLYQISCF